MNYLSYYYSPLGTITLAAEDDALIGLWFSFQKYYGSTLNTTFIVKETPLFKEVKLWLDGYFQHQNVSIPFKIELKGTAFQKEVWSYLLEIPYGQITSYKNIAQLIAQKRGISSMSAQAVGQAVGHNPISIIVPCHRVLNTQGQLSGYAGGIERKKALLRIERENKLNNHAL